MSKTFFGKILAAIGGIFVGLFKSAKKTFEQLTPEQQEALKNGSGIIALINTELGKTPAEVRASIKEQFPNLDEATLETSLFQIAHAFNLTPKVGNLEDCIYLLQTYLSLQKGNTWDGITHAAASLLAIFLAPAGTKFAAVSSLIEYVYQHFFKKQK